MYLILDRDDKRNNQYKDHQYRQKSKCIDGSMAVNYHILTFQKLFVSFKYEAESEWGHYSSTIDNKIYKKKRILVMMVKMDWWWRHMRQVKIHFWQK